MEITISLPEKVFANVANVASKTHRRIDEVIAEKLESDFSIQIENLEKQIAACYDSEIIKLSKIQMPEKQDKRLSFLLQKQSENDLTEEHRKELWKLMELNRITTLKKAFAIREISRRGLD